MEWLLMVPCLVFWLACGYLARLLFLAELRLEAGPGADRFLSRDTRLLLWVCCLAGPPVFFIALWDYSCTRCRARRGDTFAQRFRTLPDDLEEK